MIRLRTFASLFLSIGLGLVATAQTTLNTSNPQLPKESLQLPQTLDYELEQLLQRWYEGYEHRSGVPMAPTYPTAVPNVADSVYVGMMNRIPSAIRLSYNSVVRESIELYLFRRRPLLSSMMSLGDLYFPDIEAELDRHRLPLELKYLTIVESALNPQAISPVGAAGLWQFMLPTARAYGLTINSLVDERMDPVRSTEAACKMLKDLYAIYKDWWLVMAAYNCGAGNVNRAIARAGGGVKSFWDIYNFLPRETRKYVPLYIGVYFAMHYAKQYGIQPRGLGRSLATEYYEVKNELSFSRIASLTGMSTEQIKAYNPQFRRGIIPWNADAYQIRLPLKAVLTLEGYKPEEIRSQELEVREDELTQPASRLQAKSSYTYHRVGRRETVEGIARKYGVSAKNIRSWNNLGRRGLKRGQRIIVGMKEAEPQPKQAEVAKDSLSVTEPRFAPVAKAKEAEQVQEEPVSKAKKKPEREPSSKKKAVTHKVRKGDTLHEIASKYGVSVAELRRQNGIKGNNIRPGQVIKVSK